MCNEITTTGLQLKLRNTKILIDHIVHCRLNDQDHTIAPDLTETNLI